VSRQFIHDESFGEPDQKPEKRERTKRSKYNVGG